jgi:hypothetical protein
MRRKPAAPRWAYRLRTPPKNFASIVAVVIAHLLAMGMLEAGLENCGGSHADALAEFE